MDGFHITYSLDFYMIQPDFLESKNESCERENLVNTLLKQIAKLLKKTTISSKTRFYYLKNTYLLYCNYISFTSSSEYFEDKYLFCLPLSILMSSKFIDDVRVIRVRAVNM